MQVAEAWKAHEADDPDPLSFVKSSNSWHSQQLASGERLIIEGYPPAEIDGVDEYFVAVPTEWIFLTTRRVELRRLVANMKLLREQTGSKVVADSLKWLRQHIRRADELAIASGVRASAFIRLLQRESRIKD